MLTNLAQQPIGVAILSTAVVCNIVLWILALTLFPHEQAAAVLHYNIDIGIDFIGEGDQIIILPVIGLLITVGNGILGIVVRKVEPIATWLLWSIAPIINLLLIGAFFLIRQANF